MCLLYLSGVAFWLVAHGYCSIISMVCYSYHRKTQVQICCVLFFLYYTDASFSATTSCVVNYQSPLTLHCPNTSNDSSSPGQWWKQTTGGTEGICDHSNCTIGEPLHNEDSGLYFCQMGSNKYYVNVTVLGNVIHYYYTDDNGR